MRLSASQKEILSIAQLQADKPVSHLKKFCRYKEHTIRYALQRLVERKVVRPRCFVNLSRLGFNHYEVYFSLSSNRKESRAAVIKSLLASDKVSWLGQLGGDFQYGLNIASRNIAEVAEMFSKLSEEFGSLFVDKVFAERLSLKYFGNRYLSSRPRGAGATLSYGVSSDTFKIDETDHRILAAVTRAGERSSRGIAREISIPQTTVDYRLRKLEQNGVIAGYYLELQPEQLGLQSFMLLVSMKTVSATAMKGFEAYCQQQPNIVLLIHSMGSWDLEIGVDAQHALQVADMVEELYDRHGAEINWIKILPAFRNLKVAEYPFLATRPAKQ